MEFRRLEKPLCRSVKRGSTYRGPLQILVRGEIQFRFEDTLTALDWDAVYLRFLPRVKAATSTLEYYRILLEMCALLKDGHTNVIPPAALFATGFTVPPFKTRLIEDKVINH